MKQETPFAIILFFHSGLKPKQIIDMGYSASTVYKYSSKYKQALKEFQNKIGGKGK